MAVAFLNTGATSLAAANWSDTTGFAAAAQLVIRSGGQTISSDTNQSGSSIEYLDVQEGFVGQLGTSTNNLICDVDGTAENATTRVSRLRYYAGGGAIWFNAGGSNTLAHIVEINSGGTFNGTGGILKNLNLQRGTLRIGAGVLATGGIWRFTGGSSIIDAQTASAALPQLDVVAGQHVLNRSVTALNIYGGDTTLDCAGLALTTVTVTGGRLRLLNSGTITTLNAYGGVIDTSACQRPVTITTATLDFAATFLKGGNVTITNENVVGLGARGRNRI